MRKKHLKTLIVLLSVLIILSGCSSDATDFVSSDDETAIENNDEKVVDIEEYEQTDVKYEILSNGKATVIGLSGDVEEIEIDSEYKGHEVVKIADSAFENCKNLKSVIIWAEIKEIGKAAFKNCSSLTEIDIPYETETIGDNAFENCTSLKQCYIWGSPDIGKYAFAGCTKIKEIDISDDTKSIGAHAFEGCTGIEDLYLWGGENIGEYAFAGCSSIKEVSITDDIKTIGAHAFDGCSSLINVDVWGENTKIGANAFANCPKLKEIPKCENAEAVTQKETEHTTITTTETTTTTENEEEQILTVNNCKDLSKLIKLKDPCDPFIAKFAEKYEDRIIEFDGCVTAIQNHNNYNTRYDILINTGDYDPNSCCGPNFRLTDVGVYDLDLDTLYLTDEIYVGVNVHVIAELEEYNEDNTIYELDPIKVIVR
ncbi:MAG: DUF4839 domain-containing protein [Acutalibacteraceae bacterium]